MMVPGVTGLGRHTGEGVATQMTSRVAKATTVARGGPGTLVPRHGDIVVGISVLPIEPRQGRPRLLEIHEALHMGLGS